MKIQSEWGNSTISFIRDSLNQTHSDNSLEQTNNQIKPDNSKPDNSLNIPPKGKTYHR